MKKDKKVKILALCEFEENLSLHPNSDYEDIKTVCAESFPGTTQQCKILEIRKIDILN
jgi:hypothetical protein